MEYLLITINIYEIYTYALHIRHTNDMLKIVKQVPFFIPFDIYLLLTILYRL